MIYMETAHRLSDFRKKPRTQETGRQLTLTAGFIDEAGV